MHSLMQKQTQLSNRNWAHIIRTSRSVKKSSEIPTLTRAHIRASQEFLSFCCHKCHRTFPILLCSNTLRSHLEQILTDKRFNHSKSAYHNNEKHFFRPFLLLGFSIFFFTFSLLVWHLWQQKKLNRCWYARDTHAWDSFPSHRLFSLLFFEANTQKSSQSRILASRDSISNTRKENHSLFCDFFPLWGNISPYTYRGARWRCTPFSFFFHGESHSHIYADTSDNSASTIH